MAATTASNARRQNAKPISSIIKPDLVRDADCSAMAVTPEDGQFIVVLDGVGAHSTAVFHAAVHAGVGADVDDDDSNVTATDPVGRSLRMVWGSAEHTDRRSTGHKRVPHFDGDIDVEVNLYNGDDGTNVNATFPAGTPLTVAAASAAVQGSAARLVLTALPVAHYGWQVGHVLETGPAAHPASGQRVRVRLYKTPVYHAARA